MPINWSYTISGGQPHKETALVSLQGVIAGPELPYEVWGHCMIRLDYITFVLIGGKNHEQDVRFFGFLDRIWTEGPKTQEKFSKDSCGSFVLNGKPTIVLVIGTKVEIWIKGDLAWKYGPEIDVEPKNSKLVIDNNQKFLYLIGGEVDPNAVLVLDCSSGTCDGSEWTEYKGVLSTKYEKAALILIPDEIATCPN